MTRLITFKAHDNLILVLSARKIGNGKIKILVPEDDDRKRESFSEMWENKKKSISSHALYKGAMKRTWVSLLLMTKVHPRFVHSSFQRRIREWNITSCRIGYVCFLVFFLRWVLMQMWSYNPFFIVGCMTGYLLLLLYWQANFLTIDWKFETDLNFLH